MRQSGESLAGHIAYIELGPLNVLEAVTRGCDLNAQWVRGGSPDSFLARDDDESFDLRQDLIRTYLDREVSQFGPRVPAETLERLWTMPAHNHGALLNASRLAAGVGGE